MVDMLFFHMVTMTSENRTSFSNARPVKCSVRTTRPLYCHSFNIFITLKSIATKLNEIVINNPQLTASIRAGKPELTKTLFFSVVPQVPDWSTLVSKDWNGKTNPALKMYHAKIECIGLKGPDITA